MVASDRPLTCSHLPGILVTADESIMAIIKNINIRQGHTIILEDLGDKNCLIKDGTLDFLEKEVKKVCFLSISRFVPPERI